MDLNLWPITCYFDFEVVLAIDYLSYKQHYELEDLEIEEDFDLFEFVTLKEFLISKLILLLISWKFSFLFLECKLEP
jgi:hypothetical protein